MIEKKTKFEVAESQLITAIKLYFDDGDVVSIHTLVRASYEILDNICNSKKLKRGIIHEGVKSFTDPKFKKMIFKKINEAKIFFKHANEDPEGTITWNPDLSKYFIWDSISLYERLKNKEIPPEMFIFKIYFRIKNKDLWTNNNEFEGLNLKDADKKIVYNELLKKYKQVNYLI